MTRAIYSRIFAHYKLLLSTSSRKMRSVAQMDGMVHRLAGVTFAIRISQLEKDDVAFDLLLGSLPTKSECH